MTEAIELYAASKGITVDASEFARQWRAAYALETARRGSSQQPFVPLATLTLEALKVLANTRLLMELTDNDAERLNGVWRQLLPWPDTVEGLSLIHI